ncbi:MAG TPA: glucose 1-dehydrogenase, partial [Ktedonobacterales bacterium]|nr:glucose 1-dehydrogenase [Ktedonobacterales bacterium]
MMSLQGKVAIVTGGSLGIGAGIVQRLAQEGAAVALDYHTHDTQANAIAQTIKSAGGRVLVVQADVSSVASVQNLVQQTVATFGRLDILVNNAGIEEPAPFLSVDEASWERQIAVDLKGPYFATQTAAKQMAAQGGGGVIINISSVHEDLPMVGNAVYCAAKGGLRMLTRTLATELASHGIRIVNVGPGAVATPINAVTLNDPVKKQALLGEIPLGRVALPEDIANAVAWLASDQASYITGTTIFIDGGLMVYAG